MLLVVSCNVPSGHLSVEPIFETLGPPVVIAEFVDAELVSREVPALRRNTAAWRQVLSPRAFGVARLGATEPPFSGEYDDLKDRGLYRCRGCDTALFSSETKFDSGTGWPSFWAPVAAGNVWVRWDLSWGVRRREVLCRRCDSHLGHVFADGPRPTYKRYCLNSAALRFVEDD